MSVGTRITESTGIDELLSGAKAQYATRNPLSRKRQEDAERAMAGGNTRSVLYYDPFPLAFRSGHDATLISLDGDRYTDFLGEYTAGLFGHSQQPIISAIKDALDKGISYGGHNSMEAQLAAAIGSKFPSIDLIRFTNSGTEANLLAIATAKAHTKRNRVMVFRGGYHGSILSFAAPNPLNAPHEFIVATYNDAEGTRALIQENRDDLAAVIVEPMMGSGGCVAGTPEFLTMLREETRAAGSVLIFDEVMTSRLSPGGLQLTLGITPDMTALGKYLGGGMSFGAFGGNEELMSSFAPGSKNSLNHPGTFNNNVLTMTAGLAAIDVFTPEVNQDLNARGSRLREGLNEVFDSADVSMTAIGIGSMIAIHALRGPVNSFDLAFQQDHRIVELLFFHLVESGFWIARRGMIALSLPVSDGDCQSLIAAVEEFTQNYKFILSK